MRNNLQIKSSGELPQGYDVDPNKRRQGDVYISLGQKLPPGVQKREDRTLAEGEATGHHHTLTDGAVFGAATDEFQWIVLDDEAILTHQEHEAQLLNAGVGRVHIQREYHPEAVRRVAD